MSETAEIERRLHDLERRLERCRREALSDGRIDDEEQRRLDLLEGQLAQARERLAAAGGEGDSQPPGESGAASVGSQQPQTSTSPGDATDSGGATAAGPQTSADRRADQEAHEIFERVRPRLQEAAEASGDQSWLNRGAPIRDHRDAGRYQEALDAARRLEQAVDDFLRRQSSGETENAGPQTAEDRRADEQARQIFDNLRPRLQEAARLSEDESWLTRAAPIRDHRAAGRYREALEEARRLDREVTDFLRRHGGDDENQQLRNQLRDEISDGLAGLDDGVEQALQPARDGGELAPGTAQDVMDQATPANPFDS